MDEEHTKALKEKIKRLETDLELSANIGKRLVDENQALNKNLKDQEREFEAKICALTQDKHSLSLQVNALSDANENYIPTLLSEIESLKGDIESKSKGLNNSKQEAREIINQLENKIATLEEECCIKNSSIEKLTSEVNQLRTKLEDVVTLHCNGDKSETSISEDSETVLKNEYDSLLQEKEGIASKLAIATSEINTKQALLNKNQEKLVELQASLEEKECESTTLFNTTEKLKERIIELEMEIDALKFEAVDPSKKGNSLFSEIEDERQRVTKRFADMKERYQKMGDRNTLLKQENKKLQYEMANVQMLNSNRVDKKQLKDLSQTLNISREENKELRVKVHALECKIASMEKESEDRVLDLVDQKSDNYYLVMLGKVRKEKEDLLKELQNTRTMHALCRSQMIEMQHTAFENTSTLDSMRAEITKLKLQLQEANNNEGCSPETPETVVPVQNSNYRKTKAVDKGKSLFGNFKPILLQSEDTKTEVPKPLQGVPSTLPIQDDDIKKEPNSPKSSLGAVSKGKKTEGRRVAFASPKSSPETEDVGGAKGDYVPSRYRITGRKVKLPNTKIQPAPQCNIDINDCKQQ